MIGAGKMYIFPQTTNVVPFNKGCKSVYYSIILYYQSYCMDATYEGGTFVTENDESVRR
jgi:hypothetical protein